MIKKHVRTQIQLLAENEEMRRQLAEAEEVLRSIRSGEVDAIIVPSDQGEKLFTLKGADYSYRVLVEQMGEGALMLSLDGIILYCNRRFAVMVASPIEHVIGQNIRAFVRLSDRVALDAALESRTCARQEIECVLTAGASTPARLTLVFLPLEAPPVIGLTATDLTDAKHREMELVLARENLEVRITERTEELQLEIAERKGAEKEILKLNDELEQRVIERTVQLEAANKELEAFSYTISHDLRAPLRAIDGFSRILLAEYTSQLPAEAQRYLGLVGANTQQMGHLIEDLLAFSHLNRKPLNKQKVAPAKLVREVMVDLRTEQEGRQVEFMVGDLPACQADPMLLKQIYVNLLSNALKFTRMRETARIEIGCEPCEGSEASQGSSDPIYFVKDNGVGFDMQYIDKLFGVFQRLHRAEDYEGTGVGLAIVQRIVHRHGGRVWAEAEVDKGAEFYFTLEGGTR